MTGAIILYDHVNPTGAFDKTTQIDVKGAIKLLQRSNTNDAMLNALRYTTKTINNESTQKSIKALLEVKWGQIPHHWGNISLYIPVYSFSFVILCLNWAKIDLKDTKSLLYQFQISNHTLHRDHKSPQHKNIFLEMKHLILLAGGSCAGKTTLAKQAKFPNFFKSIYTHSSMSRIYVFALFGKFFGSWKKNME